MASGVDPNNDKVLNSLLEMLGASIDDFGDADTEESKGRNKSSLLRRMLLPMYRNRGEMLQSQMSQMSQSPSRGISGIKVESYSLIQVLLRIDTLQNKLLIGLIELLRPIADRFQSEDGPSLEEDIPRLIFQHLKWLDHILDRSALIQSFCSSLTALSPDSADCSKTRSILLDAIATVPELLTDYNTLDGGDDVEIVLCTLQTLRQDESLLIPCLDAIDSMPLSPDDVETVMKDALDALATVEAWGLPALTTFLINNCPRGGGNGMAKEVIEEFRKLPLGSVSGDGYSGNKTANPNDTVALMIEALSRGFSHRMDLTSTLLKSIKETKQGYNVPADIWLLACCASATHNRSQVKSVFRAKATEGGFTQHMVQKAIDGNGVALTSLFSTSLCYLADDLLRSADIEVCELGITLYQVLFEEFRGTLCLLHPLFLSFFVVF
jgi:Fanconi anemia group D2 protein